VRPDAPLLFLYILFQHWSKNARDFSGDFISPVENNYELS